jgi:hypothetical protein
MPTTPDGYTRIEDAVERWGRYRNWWYTEVREGRLIGYTFPGLRGTYLRDEDVEKYVNTPEMKRRDESAG